MTSGRASMRMTFEIQKGVTSREDSFFLSCCNEARIDSCEVKAVDCNVSATSWCRSTKRIPASVIESESALISTCSSIYTSAETVPFGPTASICSRRFSSRIVSLYVVPQSAIVAHNENIYICFTGPSPSKVSNYIME